MIDKQKREQAYAHINAIKIHNQWRKIMRMAKVEELRKEIEILSQNHEREVDRKDAVIQMLERVRTAWACFLHATCCVLLDCSVTIVVTATMQQRTAAPRVTVVGVALLSVQARTNMYVMHVALNIQPCLCPAAGP